MINTDHGSCPENQTWTGKRSVSGVIVKLLKGHPYKETTSSSNIQCWKFVGVSGSLLVSIKWWSLWNNLPENVLIGTNGVQNNYYSRYTAHMFNL